MSAPKEIHIGWDLYDGIMTSPDPRVDAEEGPSSWHDYDWSVQGKYHHEDTVVALRSSLTTALKLLRDRKGVPHWDRELSDADNDVLAMVKELE